MRWMVNENVSGTVIRTLRDRGHDVLSVKESLRGTGDPDILAQAQADERVLEVLESSVDWTGHFAVVTDDRLRIRPLPRTPEKPRYLGEAAAPRMAAFVSGKP
jgi:hypothetical protein